MKFVVSGERRETVEEFGVTLEEACRAFRERYGFVPEDWGREPETPEEATKDDLYGGTIFGFCESCDRPLLDPNEYRVDEDGVQVCEGCIAGMRAQEAT